MNIDEAIKSRFTDSFEKAMINLFYTSKFFETRMDGLFKPYGLKNQHYNVLRIIRGKHPEKINPGYVRDVMIDKRRDLTRLVDKLVDMKLVCREQCMENRRKVELSLTDQGLALTNKIEKELNRLFEQFKHMPDGAYERLSALLDQMRTIQS